MHYKQQRQPKVAVSPFMMQAARKAHQVNAEIAHFRPRATFALERLCHRQGWNWVGSNSLPLSSIRATSVSLLRCYHRSTSVQSTVSTTALTVASSTRSASASSAATVLR